uniref:alpha-L-fucosidase n=2 Tax=Timema TaxID=61471 RepID=A0A7R9E0B3_9NEOP|nr:unnamed protein product [Timema monikensis]
MAVAVWKTLSALLAVCSAARSQNFTYEANWDSLDARPIPEWYEDAKLGVFLHWGVFSVPSFKSEWFWENWESKYVVLTSKHHEGYTLWPSSYSFSWNAKDVGPARDLIAPLAESIRSNTDLKFGLYHSLLEWYNPLYLQDQANNWTTQDFVNQKTLPELYEIWTASSDYFRSKEFLAWLYNESPVKDTVAVNDRWGNDAKCQHGGYFNCDDRLNPGTLMVHKWENAMTIDKSSWGFRRNARLSNILTIEELLNNFVKAVSCNGNMLMNVGPTKEGVIAPIYEERLRQMGTWLDINGEAIYSTRYWSVQNDANNTDVWYRLSVLPSTWGYPRIYTSGIYKRKAEFRGRRVPIRRSRALIIDPLGPSRKGLSNGALSTVNQSAHFRLVFSRRNILPDDGSDLKAKTAHVIMVKAGDEDACATMAIDNIDKMS